MQQWAHPNNSCFSNHATNLKMNLIPVLIIFVAIHLSLAAPLQDDLGFVLSFTLGARDLPNADPISPPDPFVKMWHSQKELGAAKLPHSVQLVRFGTTSPADNTANPEWPEVFQFLYQPKGGQRWHFEVRDHDPLAPDDVLGEVYVDVDDYIEHEGDYYVSLSGGGQLIIRQALTIGFKIRANNLPNEDGPFMQSDPYVQIYTWDPHRPDHETLVGETNVLEDTPNPKWTTTFEFPYIPDQKLVLKFYDHDTFTTDDLLGKAIIPVNTLVDSDGPVLVYLDKSNGFATATVELAYLGD